MKKRFTFLIAALALLTMISQPTRSWGQTITTSGVFKKVTSDSSLSTGDVVIFVDETANKAAGNISSKILTAIDVTISNSVITLNNSNVIELTLGKSNNNWTFANTSSQLLGVTKVKELAWGSGTTTYTISIASGNATITSTGQNLGRFLYNNGNPRFTTYTSNTSSTMRLPQLYKKAYTVTYNANGGSGTMTDSNSPYFMNSTVTTKTNSFTRDGYSFNGWNTKANGSGTSYAENANFTITENTTLYAQWASASTVATPSIYLDGGTYTGSQSTTISCGTAGASIYYTLDGTTPSSSNGTLYSGAITIDHSCTLKAIGIKDGLTDSEIATATYTIKVDTPSFTPTGGNLFQTTSVSINCETEGASIYYTTDGTTPTSGSTLYSSAISVSSTQTLKAIAIKAGMTNSDIATATYNFPITIAAARTQGTGTVYIRGIATYVEGSYAYIQDDSEAALCLYRKDAWTSSEISVGDDVTASGTLSTYQGLLEINNPILTKLSSGNAKPCVTKTVAQINTDNFDDFQGLFVQIVEATYNGSSANTVTQNGQTVSVNGTMGEATTNDVVTFKGNITYNSGIIIRNLQDVSVIADPTISAASSISVPDYIKGTPESGIDVEILTVNGTNLTEDITVELEDGESSAFEISDDLDTWGYSITLSETDGSVSDAEIAVRLKVENNVADYSDRIILSSDGATTVNVNVTGSVTYANVTYNGNADGVTNVPTDATNYTYNQEVTVLGEGSMARTGYDFVKWTTESDGTGDEYEEYDTFDITEDVTLYAQWTAKSYSITADPAITHGSISFTVGGAATTTAQTGQTVTIVSTPDSGYGLSSFSINGGSAQTGTTFTMPASAVTVSATFVPTVTDELTASLINQSGYGNWSGKYHAGEAVYAGNSTTGGSNSSSIQLRDNTNSGIVTTTSGGTARKVSVTWNSSTTSGRTLQVYGKNEAYSGTTGASDLYDADKRGTLIGTIVYGTSTELTINDNYGYIGMRSSSGAMYLDEIEITWAAPTHAITYDANGGTGTMTDPSSPYKYNASVTVLAKANTITAPSGKMFARWDTNADGNGTSYAPGDIFSMPKNDMTLYAIWEDECNETATMAATSGTKEYVNDEGELSFKINLSSKVTALSSCADITEYGFVYSTDGITTPTVGGANCTKIVKGTEYTTANTVFEHELAGATLGATYKICSYATNLAGTVYGTMATVAIDADYPSYTISYSTNGTAEGSTTKIYQGNAISDLIEPTSEYVPAGYTFQGWSTSIVPLTDTKPSLVKNGDAISGILALKAVFAIGTTSEGEFTKSYGWEDADDASVWTITDAITKTSGQGYNSSSYAGKINSNNTYVTFKDKVKVKEFSFAFKRTSNNENYNVYIETSLLGESWEAIETYAMSSFDKNGTYAVKTHTFDGTTAQYVRFHCYNTTAERYVDDVTITYDAEYTTYSNYCTSVASIEDNPKIDADGELTDDITISSGAFYIESPITIPDGYTLTVNGTGVLANTDPANLIIEDGGQLILPDDASVQATVKNSTAASTETKTYDIQWNAISSPVDNVYVTTFVKGDKHNVYRYDVKTVYWQEYRGAYGFANLQNGRGYIYRSTESGIEFQGEVITGTVSCADYLSYACDNDRYRGFNLIGNPFTHDITWSNLTTKTNISSAGFFLLGADGNWSAQTTSGTIAPMQAFLVQAIDESPVINISNTVGKGDDDRYGNDQIQFTVNNSEYFDVAYAIFREGHGLNKIEHRNANIPMLYIINDDKDYAIAEMPDNTNVINLGFKARAIGQYTLSLNAEGRYSYMHLYDKLTGSDVDMLLDDSYTFVGSPSDRNDRFVLRLNYNAANIDTESDIFAYQNGTDIIISGTGELQIFDIMGHQVSTQRINGVETISVSTQGVYILRLVGTEIKTQKIVVR